MIEVEMRSVSAYAAKPALDATLKSDELAKAWNAGNDLRDAFLAYFFFGKGENFFSDHWNLTHAEIQSHELAR